VFNQRIPGVEQFSVNGALSLTICLSLGGRSTPSLSPSYSLRKPPRQARKPDLPYLPYLPSNSFAAAATCSGSNPNFLCSSLSGAEAPKVFMPMTRPDRPT